MRACRTSIHLLNNLRLIERTKRMNAGARACTRESMYRAREGGPPKVRGSLLRFIWVSHPAQIFLKPFMRCDMIVRS